MSRVIPNQNLSEETERSRMMYEKYTIDAANHVVEQILSILTNSFYLHQLIELLCISQFLRKWRLTAQPPRGIEVNRVV